MVLDEKEAQKRIEILQQQLVGGEQVNNEALKQKRKKKMKEAERKMQRLAGSLKLKCISLKTNQKVILFTLRSPKRSQR
jgi:hypothetical protein